MEKNQDAQKELRFPDMMHKNLLEGLFQKQQIEKEMGLVVQSYFQTLGLNPDAYNVDLINNKIIEKPKATPIKELETTQE